MKLKFKKVEEWAILPTPPREGDVGVDLFISNSFPAGVVLEPGQLVIVDTGVAYDIPDGLFGLIRPRSSAYKEGLQIEGVVDPSYTGSTKLMIRNVGNKSIPIQPGRAYAQMLLLNYNPVTEFEEVTELKQTERGSNGWGSTGGTNETKTEEKEDSQVPVQFCSTHNFYSFYARSCPTCIKEREEKFQKAAEYVLERHGETLQKLADYDKNGIVTIPHNAGDPLGCVCEDCQKLVY